MLARPSKCGPEGGAGAATRIPLILASVVVCLVAPWAAGRAAAETRSQADLSTADVVVDTSALDDGAPDTDADARAQAPVDLPKPLDPDDAKRYARIFALQRDGHWKEADALIARLHDKLLVGRVLAQRYLHPTLYRSSYKELHDWLAQYRDEPEAKRIYELALKRKPRRAAAPASPVGGYLNGSGYDVETDQAPPHRSTRDLSARDHGKKHYLKWRVRALGRGGGLGRGGLLRRLLRGRGRLLRGGLLGRGLLGRGLLGGRGRRPSRARGRLGVAPFGEQLAGPVQRDRLGRVAHAQGGVGLTVGHVETEAPGLDDHGSVGHRILAPLAPRARRRASPALLGLGQQRESLGQVDREDLLLALERARLLAPGEVGAVAAVLGQDRFSVFGMAAHLARQREPEARLLERDGLGGHRREERRRARLVLGVAHLAQLHVGSVAPRLQEDGQARGLVTAELAVVARRREQLERVREKDARARLQRRWVPYALISVNLKRAVVASEDAKFLDHAGFDWEAIEKAIEKNERRGKIVAGASTISQQLARNLLLSGERTWVRKGEEAAITWMLESTMSKRRILELYLNVAEWGDGIFGAEAAARHHFGVSAAQLGPEQAAWLAAILPSPRRYDRGRMTAYLAERIATIRARMPVAQIP